MILEPKNEGVVVKYLGEFTRNGLGERLAASGLVLPDPSVFVGDPVQETAKYGQDDQYPMLIGQVVAVGEGKRMGDGGRVKPEGIEAGAKVLFQVNHSHITHIDPDSDDVLYVIALGNIHALLED